MFCKPALLVRCHVMLQIRYLGGQVACWVRPEHVFLTLHVDTEKACTSARREIVMDWHSPIHRQTSFVGTISSVRTLSQSEDVSPTDMECILFFHGGLCVLLTGIAVMLINFLLALGYLSQVAAAVASTGHCLWVLVPILQSISFLLKEEIYLTFNYKSYPYDSTTTF